MSPALLVTLEILLVLGVVIGFGLWELWSLRRYREEDQAAREARASSRTSSPPEETRGGG